MHSLLLYNGGICAAGELLISPGQVGFLNGWGVFSTIRVKDGVLFAFERHFARMKGDAARMRVPFETSAADMERDLLTLVDANQAFNATLRVAIVRNRGGQFEGPAVERGADVIAFTADLTPWGSQVSLMYVAHGRHSASPFAGTKVTSWSQNLSWNEEAHERGFDEVILLNEHGMVSECTSANIFAIRGAEVWTPTLAGSGCLPGVTRALLLEEIRVPGMDVIERDFAPRELGEAGQVFITSTTRDLLAVGAVDGRKLQQNPPVFGRFLEAFRDYQNAYVAARNKREVAR
jgi:branched-chain amino acid aminotransferase